MRYHLFWTWSSLLTSKEFTHKNYLNAFISARLLKYDTPNMSILYIITYLHNHSRLVFFKHNRYESSSPVRSNISENQFSIQNDQDMQFRVAPDTSYEGLWLTHSFWACGRHRYQKPNNLNTYYVVMLKLYVMNVTIRAYSVGTDRLWLLINVDN